MKYVIAGAMVAAGLLAHGAVRAADAQTGGDGLGKYIVGDKRSGYVFAEPDTRAMQDDDFQNPGMVWVEAGKQLWSTPDGAAGKSCQTCHGDAATSMKGVATHYPKFNPRVGKVIDLEQRIDMCRAKALQAKPYPWESHELLAMTTFIKNQSRGMPMNVAVDGPAAPFFEKGKESFYRRRGQLDLSCASCHETLEGRHLRADVLSQGQTNGFPTYRLGWQTLGSLQKRIKGCDKQMRADPHAFGSDEYVNLELYLAWRGNGLPVETPAVRK
ncbi:MAG: sulfur oxidation c-type cytochrome SoxA [Magnetospirillum sp.]|nr:sulfur oxidation c-type cytochrome SoxA [Magnetospirillum sp.]